MRSGHSVLSLSSSAKGLGMSDAEEAEFVIAGSRGSAVPLGYDDGRGHLVDLSGAQRYDLEQALEAAQALANEKVQTVWVAPLLFGVPDMESAAQISPPQYPTAD